MLILFGSVDSGKHLSTCSRCNKQIAVSVKKIFGRIMIILLDLNHMHFIALHIFWNILKIFIFVRNQKIF